MSRSAGSLRQRESDDAIKWPQKPVYSPLSVEGVKIALMPDGRIYATIRNAVTGNHETPEYVLALSFSDTGNPWIPQHKNFNSLMKQSFREGDFDHLKKRHDRYRQEKNRKKQAAGELYDALVYARARMLREGSLSEQDMEVIDYALAKAGGKPTNQE